MRAPAVTAVTTALAAATLRAPRPAAAGSSRVRSVISQILLSLVALLFLVPIIWMVLSALKPSAEVFTVPPKLFGSEILFSNFAEAWNYLPFGRFILNTLFVAGGRHLDHPGGVGDWPGTRSPGSNFRFQGGLFVLYLSTLIVPQEVIVIPMFLVMQQLGWVNSYQALILPWAFTAFGTFLLRQFFITIPKELEEAAKIDGCGHIRILRSIIIPIAAPAIAVLAVFTFISYWNSFLWPLIIVNDTNKMTVPLGLQLFLGQQGQRWELLMAAATISMVPDRHPGPRPAEVPGPGHRALRARRTVSRWPPAPLDPRSPRAAPYAADGRGPAYPHECDRRCDHQDPTDDLDRRACARRSAAARGKPRRQPRAVPDLPARSRPGPHRARRDRHPPGRRQLHHQPRPRVAARGPRAGGRSPARGGHARPRRGTTDPRARGHRYGRQQDHRRGGPATALPHPVKAR